MGCFNVSCSISNISLVEGDDIVILPLINNPDLKKCGIDLTESSDALFMDSDLYYKPFCFPIVGKYNEYGAMEDIVEDEHTKFIEEKYGITIQQFMDAVTCDRVVCNSFSKIHENFSFIKGSYFGKKKEYLLEMGFEEVIDGERHVHLPISCENDDMFYHKITDSYLQMKHINDQRHECFSIFKINLDSDELTELVDSKREICGCDELENAYLKYLDYALPYTEDRQELVKLLNTLRPTFIHKKVYGAMSTSAVETYRQGICDKAYKKAYDEAIEDLKDEQVVLAGGKAEFRFRFSYSNDYPLYIYKSVLVDEKTTLPIADMFKTFDMFRMACRDMNYMIMPSMYASQETNDILQSSVLKIALDHVTNRIIAREEYL